MMNWESSASEILLNPRLLPSEQSNIDQALQKFSELKGHLWVATSGTTGEPKYVALSKEAILSSARGVNVHLRASSADCWIHSLPPFHVGGLGIYARAYLSQSKVIEYYSRCRWEPKSFHAQAIESNVTLTALVPTQLYDLVQCGLAAPKSLRAVIVGGGKLSKKLYHSAIALGWKILPSYGCTECASQIATAPLDSLKEECFPQAKVLSHLEVKINPEGLICVKGKSLLTGYALGNDFHFVDPKKDGWFTTEDLGKVVDSSYLEVYGRQGNFIKIGGESVNTDRLDAILEEVKSRIHFNSDAVLLPMPDERLGFVIHLFTVQNGDLLMQAFNEQVLPFERIRKVNVVDKIPKTELGKVKKEELKRTDLVSK